MKNIFTIVLINISLIINAQQLYTEKVIKVADSVMISNTNENLYRLFDISEGSYYKYIKRNNLLSTGKFLDDKKLKKNTTEIWVLYHFDYPKVEGIHGGVWVKLDNKLCLIEKLDLSFIPSFLWTNETCNFIPKQSALKIGIGLFQKSGIEINEPILEYNESFKTYTYLITNKLTKTKNQFGENSGQTEVVRIDAINGKLLERYNGSYGVIIR